MTFERATFDFHGCTDASSGRDRPTLPLVPTDRHADVVDEVIGELPHLGGKAGEVAEALRGRRELFGGHEQEAGFSAAHGINDRGQIVGRSTTTTGERHAFLWQAGVMQDLGTLGRTFSAAFGINDRGQIVGGSGTATGQVHAVLWTTL